MRRLAALSLILLFAACDTSGTDPQEQTPRDEASITDPERIDLRTLSQEEKTVVGTWEWAASVNYFTASGEPKVDTPESTGRTGRWMFLADGRALYFENGTRVRTTTYEVRTRTYANGQEDSMPSIQFADGGYGFDFGTDGDMLVLDSTPVDGPQERYKRK